MMSWEPGARGSAGRNLGEGESQGRKHTTSRQVLRQIPVSFEHLSTEHLRSALKSRWLDRIEPGEAREEM